MSPGALHLKMKTILLARQVLTPLELIRDGAVVIEDATIAAVCRIAQLPEVRRATVLDFGDAILTPGLIDLHVHGGAGHDFMHADEAGLAAIEQHMARHGVTSYCATTITAPLEATLQSLERLGKACKAKAEGNHNRARSRSLGIHLEGPFLSHARRGVHPAEHLQPPSTELLNQLCEAAGGYVRMLTIAPELAGASELIAEANRRGICAAMGHSDATLDEAQAGIRAGARHATHMFNAMRALHHRDPGIVGAVLADNLVTADVIADGIHVHPVMLELLVRTKGAGRVVLITDATSATGMPGGTYNLGDMQVEVRGGRCEINGILAGSVLTLDRAVRNMSTFVNVSFQSAICMATLNPARVLGLAGRKGVLRKGADADFTVFSTAGEVIQTIIGGRMIR